MRKTSQDGGDTTSITSGVENEIKKPSVGVIKNKRNSIKRKVQSLSHESDDAVIEPLLQKEKEKPESANQSAKFSLLKAKTDRVPERDGDKDKLLPDSKVKTSELQEVILSPSTKENITFKTQSITTAPLHNHMNTNVFSTIETTKFVTSTKNQILVEIDGCKQVDYTPSPLIFTTAKIHTDNKTKQMEPVQVTTVPILSTTEIPNAGKATNNISILQTIPSTSEVKINEKQYKSFPAITSPSFIAESSGKSEPNTTGENNSQNTLSDCAALVSSSLTKDLSKPSVITADVQVCNSSSNKIETMASVSYVGGKISQPLNNEYLAKTSQPQSLRYTDVKSPSAIHVSKASSTPSDNLTRKYNAEEIKTKLDKTPVVKNDSLKQQDSKTDENANANTDTVQQSVKQAVTDIKISRTDAKMSSDNSCKSKTPKDATSLSSNKLLLRQKNAVVEEVGDIIIKSKPSYSECLSTSNIPKFSKNSEGKTSAPAKSTMQTKVTDQNVSDKTLPKSSANNIVDTITTKIIATSILSKPTASLTSTIKSPVPGKPQSTGLTTTVSNTTKPTSKIPSIDTKKSSIISPLTSSTVSSKQQTPSSTSSSTPSTTTYNKVSTISTIKPSDTGVVAQPPVPNKLNGASIAKSAIVNVAPLVSIDKTSATTSNGSSITSKPSAVKIGSTSSITTPCAAKSTTTTAPAAKPSASSKKNGPKTNEVNKDNKGLKA